MDRFIDQQNALLYVPKSYLKSNMDRFIDDNLTYDQVVSKYLKSNMDRFIGIVNPT